MSQYPGPYPGPPAYPAGPGGHPVPQGAYPVVRAMPRYRSLRRAAQVSIGLMGLTAIAAIIQTILLWSSYDGVKRFVYGLLSEDELNRGVDRIVGTGPLLNLAGYLFLATGIAFLTWLWQARENTEAIKPAFAASYQGGYNSHSGAHRHAPGWIIGGWVCPIVQFWYPLQVVEDVVRASEPPEQPRSGRLRGLMYGWWGSWTAFWVIIVGGGGAAVVSFFVWMVRLVDRVDAADATGDYVDIYDLQDFMVRVTLAVNIGFTVATILLIAAGITISLILLRVTSWQDTQAKTLGLFPPAYPPSGPYRYAPPQHAPGYTPAPPGQVPEGAVPSGVPSRPPQYAPRPGFGGGQPGSPAEPPRSFPSYGGHQQPPGGSTPWQGPD